MTQSRETLGIAVKQDHKQGHKRKIKTKGINEPSSQNKHDTIANDKTQSRFGRQNTRRNFTNGCTRIQRIKMTIQITIKRHGCIAGRNHTNQYQAQFLQQYRRRQTRHRARHYLLIPSCNRCLWNRQEKSYQGKGHRKNGMRKFNETEVILYRIQINKNLVSGYPF